MLQLRKKMESIKKYKIWIKAMEAGAKTGCHQMPERSFFIFGYQFPVCARCTGVFIGQAAACILAAFRKILSPAISLFLLLLMGADWFIQHTGILASTNFRRLVSGILGGLGITFLYINSIIHILRIICKFMKGILKCHHFGKV